MQSQVAIYNLFSQFKYSRPKLSIALPLKKLALAAVAQWIECLPVNQKVTG